MIGKNLDLNKDHKIICFVDRITNIEEAKQNVIKWFKKELNIFEVSHKQTKNQVNNIIETFKSINGINILFCVNILNEGVHLPGVDCIIFLRKTKSNVIYNQQLGRVISSNVENPIIFDLVNNAVNPEWGYSEIFKDKAKEQNKKVEEIETKNGEKLKITLEQIDLIENLRKLSFQIVITNDIKEWLKNNSYKYNIYEIKENIKRIFDKDINKSTLIGCIRNNNLSYKKIVEMNKDDNYIKEYIIKNPDKTSQEVSKELNISYNIVKWVCKKYNIACNNKFCKEYEIEYVKNNYKNKTIIKMAKELNRSKGFVSKIINDENLDYYKYHSRSEQQRIDLTKLQIKFIKDTISKNDYINVTDLYKCFINKFGKICTLGGFRNIIKRNKIILNIEKFKRYNDRIKWLKENGSFYGLAQCAKILNAAQSTIRRICYENNIKLKNYQPENHLTEDDKNFILNNHCNQKISEMVYNLYSLTFNDGKEYYKKCRLVREYCVRKELNYKKEDQYESLRRGTESIKQAKQKIREQLDKELLYDLFITKNYTYKDTLKILEKEYNIKISEKNLRKRMKELGITKPAYLVTLNAWKTRKLLNK